MTPQEWIDKVAEYEDAAAQTRGIFLGQTVRFARDGAQHLAAALEEIARIRTEIAERDAAHKTDSELAASLCQENAELRKRVASLDHLVASVPDLVKQAFQEGFAGNAETLGRAWEKSNARKALDGEAQPRPPSWDADKEEIARLQAQLAQAERVVVPELDDDETDLAITEFSDKEEWPDDGVAADLMEYVRWGVRIGIRYASHSHSVPAIRAQGKERP